MDLIFALECRQICKTAADNTYLDRKYKQTRQSSSGSDGLMKICQFGLEFGAMLSNWITSCYWQIAFMYCEAGQQRDYKICRVKLSAHA